MRTHWPDDRSPNRSRARVTILPVSGGVAVQLFEASSDGGETWHTVFKAEHRLQSSEIGQGVVAARRGLSDMKSFKTFVVCALAMTVGCSRETTGILPPVDHDVQGSWEPAAGGFPGNSFVMALQESSGTITGTGSFAGEVGPYGSLRVTGVVRHDSVFLRIAYVPEPKVFPALRPDTAQFTGTLARKDQLSGHLMRYGTTDQFDLVRLTVGDR